MKKSEIARELGFSRQYLYKLLDGKQKTISEEIFTKLHKYFPDMKYEKINEIRYRIIRGEENDNNNNSN